MNKLIVEQNEIHLQEEDVVFEVFPNQLDLFVKGNVYCGIKEFSNQELNIHLEENSHLTLEFLGYVEHTKNKIKIENKEHSKLDLHYACIFSGENELIIENKIATSNNKNQILVRAIEDNGTLILKAIGSMEAETKNNTYLEDIKAIIQKNNSIKIMPDLIVKTDFVEAIHNATISPIDQEELFYLESKGIGKVCATSLIKEGFLKEIIEREEIKKEN